MATTTNVPECRIPDLMKRLAKLAAKCERKGLSGTILATYGDRFEVRTKKVDGNGVEFFESTWRVPVTLEVNTPKFNGWEFAATIEQVDGSDTHILRCSPEYSGDKIPNHFRTCDPCHCEHCGKRRHRRDTFVVFNAERVEFRQVGRQCLRDFLGHDPSAMVAAAGYISEAVDAVSESCEGGGFRTSRSWSIEYVLGLVSRVVAVDGWKPAAFAEKSTASTVIEYLRCGSSVSDREYVKRFESTYVVSDRSNSLLARVNARVSELTAKDMGVLSGDYEANLWTILRSGMCGTGHIGLVASTFAYAVKQENDAAKQTASATANSVHVGTVGERMRGVEADVFFTRTFEGMYGSKTIVKFNASGNLLVWWASGVPDLAAGDRVKITGTVKGHESDEYLKCACTVLSRCVTAKVDAAAVA